MQPMSPRTVQALGALNHRFYASHAASFSRRRERPWPGWKRVLAVGDPGPEQPLAVLDAGCGNGRFATFLLAQRPGPVDYLGLDDSSELLAEARRQLPTKRFLELDVLRDDLERVLGGRRFDLVALFGVLHHVPGFERRRALLERLGERLEPGGVLAATCWRFADAARLARKIVPWESYHPPAGERLDLGELEPGDLLLDWEGDGSCPRYCHLATDEEIEALVAAVPLRCRERFAADGDPAGVYNDYLLFETNR